MSVKDVVARSIDNCQHEPGVPLCVPCIEAALRKSYAAGARISDDESIDSFQAGARAERGIIAEDLEALSQELWRSGDGYGQTLSRIVATLSQYVNTGKRDSPDLRAALQAPMSDAERDIVVHVGRGLSDVVRKWMLNAADAIKKPREPGGKEWTTISEFAAKLAESWGDEIAKQIREVIQAKDDEWVKAAIPPGGPKQG